WGDQAPVCQKGKRNGAKFDDDAKCNDTGTEPVASYQANHFGLYDMHGNVREWTCSAYDKNYGGNESKCSDNAPKYVLRGGSWLNSARNLRSAYRYRNSPVNRSISFGFRVVYSE
ncbi:formylglycine-generating enzyme family protein, partial [Candidatus Venteria ishoeyi]|uniref:formylglycine-generating enzyme family protein n=1 Tax=Candidatus Venteria ishoeyi TaxID=1899563 RepID=UPI000B164D3D